MSTTIDAAIAQLENNDDWRRAYSHALLNGLIDGEPDIDKTANELFNLAQEVQLADPPSLADIRAALAADAVRNAPEYTETQPVDAFHTDNFSRVNLDCDGAFVVRLNIKTDTRNTIWTGKWIGINDDTHVVLDPLLAGRKLRDGQEFIVYVEVSTGTDQWGPMLKYRSSHDNPNPRYAANFYVSGTTCKTTLSRDDDTIY